MRICPPLWSTSLWARILFGCALSHLTTHVPEGFCYDVGMLGCVLDVVPDRLTIFTQVDNKISSIVHATVEARPFP